MKLLIVGLCCLAMASGRKITFGTPGDPFAEFKNDHDILIPEEDPNKQPTDFRGDVMKARIQNHENFNHGKGRFRFSIETENGISVSQGGKLKADGKTFVTHGSYSFTGADGRRYRTRYTADERGFHPVTKLEEIEIPDIEASALPPSPPKPTFKPIQYQNQINYLPPVNRLYLPALPATTTTSAPPPQPTPPQLPPLIEFSQGVKSYETPNRLYLPTLSATTRASLPRPPPPPPQPPRLQIKSQAIPYQLYLPAAPITTTTLRPPPQPPALPALLEVKSYANPSRTYLPANGFVPPPQNYGYY